MMSDVLNFEAHASEWPNAEHSRFVEAGDVRWHVQIAGDEAAPVVVVLLHGTGASSHSWRDVLPCLAERARVVVPDLPGHAFSGKPAALSAMSPAGMARSLAALYQTLGATPQIVVGHSAGAAIALRQALDGGADPALIVSLNGALMPFPGLSGQLLFGPLARGIARIGPLAPLFSWHVRKDRSVVRQLLRQTGSTLDLRGEHLYRLLAGCRGHVQATLDMMSQWDLSSLERDMPRLHSQVVLVSGDRDGTVPPDQALAALKRLRNARHVVLEGLGHLAHEEQPGRVSGMLEELIATL